MAAMVERPMSVLSEMQAPGPSIEIIDVDAFEDEGLNLISDLEESSLPTFNPRPVPRPLERSLRRPTPQTIYLLDSDDDDSIVASGSGINSNTDIGQPSHSRRILSPPPLRNVPVTMIPPVPPVPSRFAGQTSLPMRLQPPPFPAPPVVRPTSRPFAFENALDVPIAGPSNHRHRRQNDVPAPQAAPPSHHTPSMGLGGAIISSHRLRNSSESQIAGVISGAATRRMHMPSFASRLVDLARFSSFAFGQVPSSNVIMNDNELDDLFGDDGGLFGIRRDPNHHRRQTGTHNKEQYLSSYTHPAQPDPGFTFDFALPISSSTSADTYHRTRLFPPTSINNPIVLDDDDDDDGNVSSTTMAGPSSSSSTSDTGQVTATLVCANCSDLLLINAALHPSENDRRVWALRCGHIIDEKCLNQLGQPPRVSIDNSPDHERGNGKAKDDSGASYGDTIVSENQTVLEAIQENSIRSRLRTRPGSIGFNGPSSSVSSISPSLLDLPYRLPSLKRRRVSNKKKKVEAEFLWKCPVFHCGRVHASIKVDGVWGPEKEKEGFVGKNMGAGQPRGAIPIFA